MHEQIFASLAIINVEFENKRDHIDNFVPFVAGILCETKDEVVSSDELQSRIFQRFKN